MKFEFKSLNDLDAIVGTSCLMEWKNAESQEDAAIIEGKLLTAFGAPACVSENYENSFDYIIRATAADGRSVVLSVYGMGLVHIGSRQNDEFSISAAEALIEFVDSFTASDFERTVYYLDFCLQIDIAVKNGIPSISQSEISEEETNELYDKWYE